VPDASDNCTLVANPGQCGSDSDGYGNHCDGDLNNNGFVNSQNFILFRQRLGILSGPSGLHLCTRGTLGCEWQPGDLNTRPQQAWNDLTGCSTTFNTIYAATFGVVEVGIAGEAGYSMRFSSTLAVQNYLVTFGTPDALNADLLNLSTSSSGTYGGEVLALQLNVDFSAAGAMGGTTTIRFGDLQLCEMSDTSLNNRTVSGFLALANSVLGGTTGTGYTPAALRDVALNLNTAFAARTVSSFAKDHLVNGACP